MKKVIVTILTLLISTVFVTSYQLYAIEGYGLTSTPGYLEFTGPGVNDGNEPSLNYIEKDNNLFFDFRIPMYQVGGDGYYSGFWVMNETKTDGYTLFKSNVVGPYYAKIWHSTPVIKTYDYIVFQHRGSKAQIINTANINSLEFFEDNGNFKILIRKIDTTIYSNVSVEPGEELTVYYTNSSPISDYSSLPTTNNVKYPASISVISGGYQITIPIDTQLYTIQVDNLPIYLIESKEVYYTTDSAENRLLIGLYSGSRPFYNAGTFDDKILQNSFIAYNVGTGSYKRSEMNTIHAMTYNGSNMVFANNLYADIVIPHELDSLQAITVSYRYKHKYLNGSISDNWTTVSERLLIEGQNANFEFPWWTDFIVNRLLTYKKFAITEITPVEATTEYKENYVNWLMDHGSGTYNVNDIFTTYSKVYTLFLGNYEKFWSVGVFTEKFVVINYRYIHDGVEYSNPFPDTEAPDMKEPPGPLDWFFDFLNRVWGFFLKYSWIILVVLGIYTAQFPIKAVQIITGNKKVKNRFWIVTGWIALLIGGWYLVTLGL